MHYRMCCLASSTQLQHDPYHPVCIRGCLTLTVPLPWPQPAPPADLLNLAIRLGLPSDQLLAALLALPSGQATYAALPLTIIRWMLFDPQRLLPPMLAAAAGEPLPQRLLDLAAALSSAAAVAAAAPKLAKGSAQVAEQVLLGAMETLRRSAAGAGGRPDVAMSGFASAFLHNAPLLRRMVSGPAATADSRAGFMRLLGALLEVAAGQLYAGLKPAAATAAVPAAGLAAQLSGSSPAGAAAATAGAEALVECYCYVLGLRKQEKQPDPLPLWVAVLGLLRHMLGLPSGQAGQPSGQPAPLQQVLACLTSLVVDTFPATTVGMQRWVGPEAACLRTCLLA